MEIVKVSSKYQIVIPRSIRERMDIKPGQQVALFRFKGTLRLVPIRPMEEMEGFIKGVKIDFEREPDREV